MGEKIAIQELFPKLENAINQVKGVLSSKIIGNEEEITEIHVVANKARNAKQLVRDIETVVQVSGGISVDHKKISIAQVAQAKPLERPRLTNVNVEFDGLTAVVRVTMNHNGETVVSEVEGVRSEKNILRLAAQAALMAVERLLQTQVRFAVDQVMLVPIGISQLISISVIVVTPQGEENLLGSTYVDNSSNATEAACKAALDAINRRLGELSQ